MRADVYLHHVRLFKTRTLSAQACSKGSVRLGGQTLKPARHLKPGDVLEVERGDLVSVVRVLDLPGHRVGAPLVARFLEDLTPPENLQRAATARQERAWTAPHAAATRPDKRQLRTIRAWLGRDGPA